MKKASPIDLRSIRYLIAIVDEGSFARASSVLNVTQPALSRSVQSLERALGAKLLDRGRSGVTPTVFGRLAIERGRRLISDADAITRELALLGGGETGEIRVGAGTYPADISVGDAAARLMAERPGLKLRITIGDWPDLTASVLCERLDLAICEIASGEIDPRLCTELLPQHQGVLFCRPGHPLASRSSVTWDDIREFPFALTALPERLATHFRREESHGDDATSHTVHVDTFQLARSIVLQSNCIGGATQAQIAADVREGRAILLPIHLPWFVTRYGFIHLAGRSLPPSLQLFIAQVRAVESELAAQTAAPKAGNPSRHATAARNPPGASTNAPTNRASSTADPTDMRRKRR